MAQTKKIIAENCQKQEKIERHSHKVQMWKL